MAAAKYTSKWSELRGESCTAGEIESVEGMGLFGTIEHVSLPYATTGQSYRNIATRRADTWVRPYAYYAHDY